jgi:hypothetical protein
LLQEKLEELTLSVDDNVTRTGFVCTKCFRSLESFHERKNKLLGRVHEAVKYMSTFPKPVDDNNTAQAVSLLGKRQAAADPSVDTGLSVKFKRSRIQYNLPSATTSSPDVQVRLLPDKF